LQEIMTRKRLSFLAPAPALAVIGVGVATVGVSDPSSRLAVPFLAVLGLLITEGLARLQSNADRVVYLRNLMLLGVAVRLFVFALMHQTVGPYVFAPDQWTYESRGIGLLNYWSGLGPMPSRMMATLQLAYPAINATLFALFGFAKAAPAVLNMFFSVWTAIPIYHLALLLVRRNERVARLAAGLTVFFPSLILWSVLNIREAPTILVLVGAVYFCARLQHRPNLGALAGALVTLGLLTLFREYLTLLVGGAAVAGIMMGRSRSPARAFVAGTILLITLAYGAQVVGLGRTLAGEPTLDQVQQVREGFLYGANSAYGQGANVSTAAGALGFLPVGLAFFMLAPFPWEIGSTLQAMTLPETLLWYAILPLGIWGAILGLRHDPRAYTVPLTALVLVIFAYALVEANVGTAYRHRAQVLPVIFLFCALGIRDVQALYLARRKARAEKGRRAKSLATGPLVRPPAGGSPPP
jgi:hypothetical protein